MMVEKKEGIANRRWGREKFKKGVPEDRQTDRQTQDG